MKGIIKFFIGLLVVLALITIGLFITAIILMNMTPNKLKCGDKVIINGKSCNDLGIGDVKIKTMISDCSDIKDKKNVVTNPYNKEDALTEIMPMMEKIGCITDGEIDFDALYGSYSTLTDKYLFELSDTSVAYLLNESIAYFISESDDLSNNTLELSEVCFYGDRKEIRVVYKVSIEEFKNKLEEAIPSYISRFINMPKEVHLVCYYDVLVSATGTLELSNENVYINDVDTPFANAILEAFSTDANNLSNNGFAEAITEGISCLGRIGTATTDSLGIVVSGTENYGLVGYKNGKISLIYGA